MGEVMNQDAKTSSASSFLNLSNPRYPRLFMVLGLAIILFVMNFVKGNFGQIGDDSDDLLRYVQIRDYLHGQSWFDTDQYRMGLTAAGTDMHWSRLPDIPIILLTHIFDIFTSQDKALNIAISIWPPLSGLIFFMAMLIGADNIKFEGQRKHLKVFTILLAAFFVVTNSRFESGSIDHHNVQFAFIALAIVWVLDNQMRGSRYFLSGLATAICIAIGPEIYLMAAVICGFVALNWAIIGHTARRAAQGFGCGLALGMIVLFFATIAPAEYGLIYCDALSLITVIAAIVGGGGLALCAGMSRSYGGDNSLIRRFIGLAVLGVICVVALSFQGPQCLANPLNSLPPQVTKLWLGYITEAAPLYGLSSNHLGLIPTIVGPSLTALCILIYGYYTRFKADGFGPKLWDTDALLTMLLLSAIALTIYQVRFWPFIYIFTFFIFAKWITQVYQNGLRKGGTNIKYILCVAMSLPVIWGALGSLFLPADNQPPASANANLPNSAKIQNSANVDEKITDCMTGDVLAALNNVPASLLATSSSMTGAILIHTPHSVISGNYHRNWEGISAEIKMSIAAPDEAYNLLKTHKIDYFFYCEVPEMKRFERYNPDGLIAQIAAGHDFDFLKPVSDPALENGRATLFKVIQK